MARPPDLQLKLEGSDKHILPRGGGPHTQFSVTSAATTGPMSPTRTVKPVRLVMYTMKDKTVDMRFASGRLTTAKQILDKVLTELGIPQAHWKMFSLWLKSNHLQLQLKAYHLPCKLFKRWKDLLSQYTSVTYEDVCKDEPFLCVQRNAFLCLKEEKELLGPGADKTTIDYLYHEAVHNVTKSPYPVSREELHELAAIQATVHRIEHPGQPAQSHISHFYPSYMYVESRRGSLFSSKPSVLQQTQDEFHRKLAVYNGYSDADELKASYLKKCWKHGSYGSVLFKGQIQKVPKAKHKLYYSDRQVHVAVNMESVFILSATSPTEVLLHVHLDHVHWQFAPCNDEGEDCFSSLWLEYEAEGERQKVFRHLRVFSRQAPMMDAMLGRCVADNEKRGQEQTMVPAAGESPRQVHQSSEHKLVCEEYSEDGVCLRTTQSSLLRKKKKASISQEYSMKELSGRDRLQSKDDSNAGLVPE